MTAFKVTGGTSIFGAGVGFSQDSAAADSLTVDPDAFVVATGTGAAGALLANTGAWTATINGTVYSDSNVEGYGLLVEFGNAAMSKITIGQQGSIFGDIGIAAGSAIAIVNKGNIGGLNTAISAIADLTLTNSGAIRGDIVHLDIDHVVKITNTSTGKVFGDIVIFGEIATLANSGELPGAVGFAADLVTVSNSNWISVLEFGNGKNMLTNTGSISSLIFENGKNVLTNSGSIGGIVFGPSGTEIVTNSGTINGSIDFRGENDIFKNTSLADLDSIDMGEGDDQFIGGNGEETVFDNAGADKYSFGGGNDTYRVVAVAGDGLDTIDGGAGVDAYEAFGAGVGVNINLDKVAHNFGPVNSGLTLAANTAMQGADKDIVKNFEDAAGSEFNDNIAGSAAANYIYGADGNDVIFGYAGNDRLDGGENIDRLIGGAGADRLTGGGGTDLFYYEKTTDSQLTGRDRITDFNAAAGEFIFLDAIDANTKNGSATNDAFVYIGANVSFTGIAGQFRSYFTEYGHILEGDVNGDKKADIAIEVGGDANHAIDWTAGNLIL